MSISLSDLVDSLKREVNSPGADKYTDASEDDYVGYLSDGFWEAYLDGLLGGYTELDGDVSPTSGTTELSKDFQQIIVMYAGVKIVRTALMNSQTKFNAKAGPVEIDIENSSKILSDLLKELQDRRTRLLLRLADAGILPGFAYIDMVEARSNSLYLGESYWYS